MNNDMTKISKRMTRSLQDFDYNLSALCYDEIYHNIARLVPGNTVDFSCFSQEIEIACELVCAAICHNINWDFLREAIFKKVLNDENWVSLDRLMNTDENEVYRLLCDYHDKDRIRSRERASMLREMAQYIYKTKGDYLSIFFDNNGDLRSADNIELFFDGCLPFSTDPQRKKYQLVLQTLSDDSQFQTLSGYYRPTIDYHLIRFYIRRGVVRPRNSYAHNYFFSRDLIRKESTLAAVRKKCADSMNTISWLTSMDIKSVNRVEWWVARTICVKNCPDCDLKLKDSEWLIDSFEKCPFYEVCRARYETQYLNINEPRYGGNSY